MDNGYPMGAELDPNAPYNQEVNEPKTINVTIDLCISKTVPIEVTDYTVDEDGNPDFYSCDLYEAVSNQMYLPTELSKTITKSFDTVKDLKDFKYCNKNALIDGADWDVDDYTITIE